MKFSDLPAKTTTPFASMGAKTTIPVPSQQGTTPGAASFTDGFPPQTMTPIENGGTPPYGTDMNGILFHGTSLTRWYSAGGPIQFDPAFAAAVGGYPKGARVVDATTPGLLWISNADDNTTNPATTGQTAWTPAILPSFTPVQQGSGIGQTTVDKIYLGYATTGKLKATVNSTDFGNVAFESYVNSATQALANQAYSALQATQVNVRQDRFVGGDGYDVEPTLNFTTGNSYQSLFASAKVNIGAGNNGATPASYNATLICDQTNASTSDTVNTPSGYLLTQNLSPNTAYAVRLKVVCGNSGGQAWPVLSLILAIAVLPGRWAS